MNISYKGIKNLGSEVENKIYKTCKGKEHIKLTVGILCNDNIDIQVFGQPRQVIENKMYTYEIGSITKIFTGALFSKLLFEGKMLITDSIQKYISELEDGYYYPSLQQLATHTSGYLSRLPLSQ